MRKFYLSTGIGLEKILETEIQRLGLPVQVLSRFVGGIEIEAPLEMGLSLNLHSKIANRILLRLDEFKVRDLPSLYKKIQKIGWREYKISRESEFFVACSKSRLNHEKKVKESLEEGLKNYFKAYEPKADAWKADIYIRIHDDICQVSLDTSGDSLYKRYGEKLVGEAPLRETFAAAMVELLKDEFTEDLIVVDPFCGSGTILREILNFSEPSARKFAFQNFYSGQLPSINKASLPFQTIMGGDLSAEMLRISRQNLQNENVKLVEKDALELLQSLEPGKFIVITNPPYGERIEIDSIYLKKVFEFIDRNAKAYAYLAMPKFKTKSSLRIKNSGIELTLNYKKSFKDI